MTDAEILGKTLGTNLVQQEATNINVTKSDSVLSDIKILEQEVTLQPLYFTGSTRSPFGESGSDYRFVLGHTIAGVLGSVDHNPLGSNYGSYTDVIIKQANNIYREYIDDERFNDDTQTTGSWVTGSHIMLQKLAPGVGSLTQAYCSFWNTLGDFNDDTGSNTFVRNPLFFANKVDGIFGNGANACGIDKVPTSFISVDTTGKDSWTGSVHMNMIVKMNEIHSGSTYPMLRQESASAGSREFGINGVGSIYVNHTYANGSEEEWFATYPGSASRLYRNISYVYGDTLTYGVGSCGIHFYVDETEILNGSSTYFDSSNGENLAQNGSVFIGPDYFVGSIDLFILEKTGLYPDYTYDKSKIYTRNVSLNAGSFTTFKLETGSFSGPKLEGYIVSDTGSAYFATGSATNITLTLGSDVKFNNVRFIFQQQNLGMEPTYIYNKDSTDSNTTEVIKCTMN